MNKVLMHGTLGLCCLSSSHWTLVTNFHAKEGTAKHVMIWIRLPGLPTGYWARRFVLQIAIIASTPFCFDSCTKRRLKSFFACAHVLNDISKAFGPWNHHHYEITKVFGNLLYMRCYCLLLWVWAFMIWYMHTNVDWKFCLCLCLDWYYQTFYPGRLSNKWVVHNVACFWLEIQLDFCSIS